MTSAVILAYVGVVFMVGLAGLASAVGTSICGMAAVGAMKQLPDKFGQYMLLSVLPSTQGLYGFAGYYLMSGFITPEMTMFTAAAVFGSGLMMGVVAIASAYMQARVCANGIAAVGQGHDVAVKTMIMAAFPELYAILGLATVFLVSTVL